MITVQGLLDLCEFCDHAIVIYDENVVGDASDNYGDLLWDSTTGDIFPAEVGDLEVASFDLEDDLFRIWAIGWGVPNRYGVPYQQ